MAISSRRLFDPSDPTAAIASETYPMYQQLSKKSTTKDSIGKTKKEKVRTLFFFFFGFSVLLVARDGDRVASRSDRAP